MYCLAAFIVIGALWSTPSVLSVDCNKVLGEMLTCFSQSGIRGDAFNGADVQTAIVSNSNFVCSNKVAFKSLLSCVMGVARTCIPAGQDPAILPDTNKMTDGIDYLYYDADCVLKREPVITECANNKTQASAGSQSADSDKVRVCTRFDASKDCARQNLGVCSGRTKDLFIDYVEYNIPTACSGGTSAGGASCVFLMFAALLAVICRY